MDSNTLWQIINKHFEGTPNHLVSHHIDSYNDFFKKDIYELFKNRNPIQIVSAKRPDSDEFKHTCNLYLGGRDGRKIYFGKPIIHDGERGAHYMYPNEARLRNMTYAMTVHYDVEVEFIDILEPGEEPYIIRPEFLSDEEVAQLGGYLGGGTDENDLDYYNDHKDHEDKNPKNYKSDGGALLAQEAEMEGGGPKKKVSVETVGPKRQISAPMTPALSKALMEARARSVEGITQRRHALLKRVYLGKIPIMIQSDFCILNGMSRELRHSLGECKNDPGGYFIINGKEKTIAVQEKFGDNMLYIRKGRPSKDKTGETETDDDYLFSAEMRSVSENVAKPKRTMSVKLMAPTKRYTNRNLMVFIPNVRDPIPLFILFRALGVLSDKEIITMCLLDLDKYDFLMDWFEPSVHDAGSIMQQHLALKYIGELTKFHSEKYALEILADYFLPHVGETNYMDKAYYLGYMVFRLCCAANGLEPETDRDNLKYKRLEPFGVLFNDLFQEYYAEQQKFIAQEFDKRITYNAAAYEHDLPSLILENQRTVFGERIVDAGIKKAFKGGWGGKPHTKRVGVVQDLNRISFNSALCHLRKINLPLDSGSKVVGPRILHNSHWGFFDFIDTPDGANIGLHKTFAITSYMTRGYSREHAIKWLKERAGMRPISDFTPLVLSTMTKVFVNGHWAGVIDNPMECVPKMHIYRRNGLLPLHTSIAFNISQNSVEIYTDAGRFVRPIFYKDEISGKWTFDLAKKEIERGEYTWEELVSGFNPKLVASSYNVKDVVIRDLGELYPNVDGEKEPTKFERFLKHKAVIEYIDPNETEHSLIAQDTKDWNNNLDKQARYTHMEIHHSFLFGIMCNQSIFAETNPAARVSFSCSQSRQACSVYHSNFHNRMDKTAIVLNYGQTPLLKTRLLQHIDKEEHPYGENVIVAIMCYTGYNVEDAILVNEGSIKRGLFNTTYYTTYSEHEEKKQTQTGEGDAAKVSSVVSRRFTNLENEPLVVGLKPSHDYSRLDNYGLIRENTPVDDKTIIIGLTTSNEAKPNVRVDMSKTTKKGQLGIVDKAFITEGEEGERIAKVRIREMRIPNLGDKMASRAGQKGVVGLVIPESDMPYTKDGLKPDLIINPHALPTRQTIGHLVECLIGKVCTMYGGYSDCTAFNNEGSKAAIYGRLLPEVGFHSSGHDIMYNGMTGEQIETEIFIGPNYYMRLKHMVKDKINYRASGPRTALTRQPVSGRANDGGLRIGEMERDAVIGHGISEFLRESMMERGDEYQMVVCNATGTLAVYNKARDLFMSPMADGPLRFFKSESGKGYSLDTVTKYGRKFSVVSIPYSLKLLIQELAAINIHLRIITEDNIDQIESMGYSDNLKRLTMKPDMTPDKLVKEMETALRTGTNAVNTPDDRMAFVPGKSDSPIESSSPIEYELPASPAQQPASPAQQPASPAQQPVSPAYMPSSEGATPESKSSLDFPNYYERTEGENGALQVAPKYEFPDDLQYYFMNLSKEEKNKVLSMPREEQIEYLRATKTREEEKPKSLLESVGSALGFKGGKKDRGSYAVDDFKLGQMVFFSRSTDLGLPYDHPWYILKKGGRLLTISSEKKVGVSLTASDYVQIASPDELILPDEFIQWQETRANIQEQQQHQHQDMPQMVPYPQMAQPNINIRVVAGDDNSKNDNSSQDKMSGGDPFETLVIPKQNGGSERSAGGGGTVKEQTAGGTKKEQSDGSDKTIMGTMAQLGGVLINKIL
jgi:DNA-directed RNA polymerase II subunit RPB2